MNLGARAPLPQRRTAPVDSRNDGVDADCNLDDSSNVITGLEFLELLLINSQRVLPICNTCILLLLCTAATADVFDRSNVCFSKE